MPESVSESSVSDTINQSVSEGQWLLNKSEGEVADFPIDEGKTCWPVNEQLDYNIMGFSYECVGAISFKELYLKVLKSIICSLILWSLWLYLVLFLVFVVTRQRAMEKALRLRAEQSMASTLKDTSEIPVSFLCAENLV